MADTSHVLTLFTKVFSSRQSCWSDPEARTALCHYAQPCSIQREILRRAYSDGF